MFCEHCGAQLSDDDNFCYQCGTKTSKSNPVHYSNDAKNLQNYSNVQTSNQNNKGGCFKFILKGLGILMLVGMIGSCMGSSDSKDTSARPEPTQKVENKVDAEKPAEKNSEEVKQEKVVESPAPVPAQTQAAPQQQVVNDQRSFVANAKTGKIHVSTCRSVSRMKEANKVYITGSAAAKASGYSPCVNCRPF